MSTEGEEDAIPFLCGVETPLEIEYDWHSEHTLSATVVQEMIEATGVEAADIPQSFYESVDPDALEDLFRPQMNGTPRKNGKTEFPFAGHYITVRSDGQIIIESELGRLKRTGGNILLIGDVPEEVFNQMSVNLLGDPTLDRTIFFAQYGRDPEIARSRLSLAEAPSDRAHIMAHEAAARSAAQMPASQSSRTSVLSVNGSLEEFQIAIREQVFDLQRQRNGFDPAELRFCFDSLRLLLEEEDAETAERFIAPVTEAVEDVHGLGHYILEDTYDSPSFQAVRSIFDVVIELEFGVTGPEQRWHLNDTDHTTKWFPL